MITGGTIFLLRRHNSFASFNASCWFTAIAIVADLTVGVMLRG